MGLKVHNLGLRIFCYTLNPEQPESVGFRVQGMTIRGGSARTSPCRLGIGITGVSMWLKGVMNLSPPDPPGIIHISYNGDVLIRFQRFRMDVEVLPSGAS